MYASAAVLALVGCVPSTQGWGSSHAPSRTSPPTATHTDEASTTTPAPPTSATPTTTQSPGSAGPDPAAARSLAIQACQAIAGGFAAGSVAQARPLAAEAATHDAIWRPLADDLDFIEKNPIDPETGEGPQETIDDSTTAAHDCYTLAGVQVSQD
jgi:hypothetical protein